MAEAILIYAAKSKILRRVVVTADGDPPLDVQLHLAPGEAALAIDPKGPMSPAALAGLVEKATGVAPPDSRHAVVDAKGRVVAILHCDPDLDRVPEHSLIPAYAGVSDACTYDSLADVFVAPLVTVAEAGDLGQDGKPLATDVVSGGILAKPNQDDLASAAAENIS